MTTAAQPPAAGDRSEAAFDVIVVGSGAAGMTAGLTAARHGLRALVVEKASRFGGSTARSGGGVWIPNNEVLTRDGVTDTPEDARAYLAHIVGDAVSEDRQRAFLDHGPRMLSAVLAQTPLRMRWVPQYSDYYPEAPGGRGGGRSVEPDVLDGRRVLPEHLDELERDYGRSPRNLVVTQADFRWLNLIARRPRGLLRALRVGIRWTWANLRGKRLLARGQAFSAGLRAGLRDAGVPLWLDTRMLRLEQDDTGRVTGITVERDGDRISLQARLGVVLTAGGFEHNDTMRQEYQPAPIGTEWTVGAKANTGDAIEAAQELGAAVDLMDDAWWGPSIPLSGGPWFCLAERTLPGCVMVNGQAERFVNEASPYIDAVHAMYGNGDEDATNMPTWLVFDQRYRNRYVFAGLGPRQPFPGRWRKAGALYTASTIEKLATEIGLSDDALRSTVETFNSYARAGQDPDFHRGESVYDRYYGDPSNRPNPCLAELRVPPFHAVKIVPGDLGTKGGLCTDVDARVLREDGSPIAGLYAAGNTSSAVMGHTYAGPGATLGPAMTFAHLAVEHLAAGAEGTRQTTAARHRADP